MAHMNESTKQRLSLSSMAVSKMVDPRNGVPLRPLGVLPSGKVVWPMMGASPDDPSSKDKDADSDKDDADDDDGADDADDDPEGGTDDDDGGKDDADKGDAQAKIADLEEEKERHYRRRKEAEKNLAEMQKRLDALEGKDTPDTDKLKEQVGKLESTVETLNSSLQAAHLENAFLKDNTYQWHNPGRALKLADLSDVEIDDDGQVHGLKKALDALAKSDAYLLKTGDSKDKDKKDAPNTESGRSKSKREQKDKSEDEKTKGLITKYPALRR